MNEDKLLQKMTVGDTLDYSIRIFVRNFKKIVLLALIFYVPFMVLYTAAASYLSTELMSFVTGYGLEPNFDAMEQATRQISRLLAYYLAMGGLSLLYFVYSITLKPVMDAGIIRITYNYATSREIPGIKELIRQSFKKLLPMLLNKLLYGMIIFAVTTAVVIVAYVILFALLIGVLAGSAGQGAPSAGLIGAVVMLSVNLGTAVLIGIIYVAIKYLFGEQAIILENKSAIEGLTRSARLVKGSYLHTAAAYVFGWLLFFAVPQMLASLSYLLIYLHKDLYIIGTSASQLINSILYPFIIILTTVLYINLKIRREGFDLEQKVDILIEKQNKSDESATDGVNNA